MSEGDVYGTASRNREDNYNQQSNCSQENYEKPQYERNGRQESSHDSLIEVPDYVESWDLESRLKGKK